MQARILASITMILAAGSAPLLAQWNQPNPPNGPISSAGTASVGIGSTPVNWKLETYMTNSNTAAGITGGGTAAVFVNQNAGVNTKAGIGLSANYGTASYLTNMWTRLVNAGGASSLNFTVYSGSAWIDPAMTIDSNGYVGIGVTAPAYPLDVVGSIHASGDITATGHIYATYQDLAEWVPTDANLRAGTVVVIARGNDNHVVPSRHAYDTTVAGVASENPGIALGQTGSNKATIATTGRVRVRVDASRTPIHRGDLLVTSNTPGMAMRSQPIEVAGITMHRPGTILGKALEPLDRGRGEILVLLTLQ